MKFYEHEGIIYFDLKRDAEQFVETHRRFVDVDVKRYELHPLGWVIVLNKQISEEIGRPVEFVYHNTLLWSFFTSNINANLKRDVPHLFDVVKLGSATGACAIIAGGPSLKGQIDELKKFEGDIFGCGTVHDYLIENGIIPTYHVLLDPDTETAGFVTKPHKDVTYLVASQCHEKTFDALKDHKLLMWNAHLTTDDNQTPLTDFNGEISVRGGDSVVLRTYPLASLLGYKKFHFFGFDCSFPLECEDQHVYKYDHFKENTVSVSIDGIKYYTTPALMIQLKTFATYVALSHNQEEFVVHGDSLIARVCYRDVQSWSEELS